jgi:FdhE protein
MGGPSVVAPEIQAGLEELDRITQQRPALAGPGTLLRAILPGLYQETSHDTRPALSRERVAEKVVAGLPLLRGEAMPIDAKGLRRRWLRACAVMQEHQADGMGKVLAESVRRERLDLEELAQHVLSGRPEMVHSQAEALGAPAPLTGTLLRLCLFPALAQINAALEPLRAGLRWDRGFCPTCGSWPLLGEFRGLEQDRFLRCGLCAADWSFPRLQCPYCLTTDHHVLGYFGVDGELSRYRAATCETCRGYVKTVATLEPLQGPRLLIADTATLHLDLAAAERGYANP